ncbi:MAG: hypothetical protein HYU67_05885 [Flavobacteriia bacterium]|nr:hypothetical protein [Flavobacteriia bacterium]
MKKFNYSFVLLIAVSTFLLLSQTFQFNPETGDQQLDFKLNEINSNALSDINQFVERVSEVYVVDPNKVKDLLNFMNPADILISFQIQNITDYTLAEIVEHYRTNEEKSWHNMLPHFGITKTSYEYVELKKIKKFYEPSYTIKNLSKVK